MDVFGSGIHGLGLFCIKDIDPGDMVIEYTGTVIRSVLTDKREKIYDSKVSVGVCVWVCVGWSMSCDRLRFSYNVQSYKILKQKAEMLL